MWLVNSCTVKSPSQSAMNSVILEAQRLGKGLVVAGCVPQGDKKAKELKVNRLYPLPRPYSGQTQPAVT